MNLTFNAVLFNPWNKILNEGMVSLLVGLTASVLDRSRKAASFPRKLRLGKYRRTLPANRQIVDESEKKYTYKLTLSRVRIFAAWTLVRCSSRLIEGGSHFFGAFSEFRKAAVRLHHVCCRVRMEQLGSHWKDFSLNLICDYFSNIRREI